MLACNDNAPYRPDLIAETLRILQLAIDNGVVECKDEYEVVRTISLMHPHELQAVILNLSCRLERT